MKPDTALRLIQGLTLIRFFPQNGSAVATLVEMVCEWCKGTTDQTPEQQCKALVRKAVQEWDEWQGAKALQALFLDLYPPPPKYSSDGTDPHAVWVAPWAGETK